MTDDEIKTVVHDYIINCFESDNADCLHEMDEWEPYLSQSDDGPLMKAYEFYRRAKVTVTFE